METAGAGTREHRLAGDAFVGTPRLFRQHAGFSFGHWLATPVGDDVPEHVHVAAHFMFIAGGRFVTAAAGADRASPLIYNPPNTVHRDRFESPSGRFFAVSADAAAFCDIEPPPGVAHRIENVGLHAIVIRLMHECEWWSDDSPAIAESLCVALFAGMNRRGRFVAPRWLATATERLCEEYETPVAIADLARDLGVHRTHLSRTFLRAHGCTPAEFARLHRIRRAATMLASTRTPIAEIALASGFSDQSHFTKHFRRAWGIAPGLYRRLAR